MLCWEVYWLTCCSQNSPKMDGYLAVICICKNIYIYMDVSENSGTPKSSILMGFSIINHPFWGTPIFGNTHIHA